MRRRVSETIGISQVRADVLPPDRMRPSVGEKDEQVFKKEQKLLVFLISSLQFSRVSSQ